MHLRPTVQQDLKIDFAQHSCHAFAQLQHDSSFLFTDKSSELRAGSGKKEVRTGMKPCLSYSAYLPLPFLPLPCLLLSLSISLASLYVPSLSRDPQVPPNGYGRSLADKRFRVHYEPRKYRYGIPSHTTPLPALQQFIVQSINIVIQLNSYKSSDVAEMAAQCCTSGIVKRWDWDGSVIG